MTRRPLPAALHWTGAHSLPGWITFLVDRVGFKWTIADRCPSDRRRLKMSTIVSNLSDQRRRQGQRAGHRLPFGGNTYYLDLKTCTSQLRLQRDIVHMGGKVDTFLSSQVTHLVTSKPTTLPRRESKVDTTGHTYEPVALSRGLALLKLSNRTQSPAGGKSGVAARARQLGVSVITLSDILDQIKRHAETRAELAPPIIAHERGTTVVKQLRGVFVKIEDDSRKFRPIMQRFQSFPAIVADSTHVTSPFLNNQHVKTALKKAESTRCSSQSVTQPSTKAAEKKTYRKDGFCECCDAYYEDINQHRRSEKHKQYASCDENYASLDTVISQLSPIESLLAAFDVATPVLDCLRNTNCHADMSSLLLYDNPIYPVQLTECGKALTEDNNNNTNNAESLPVFNSKHSPSNDYFDANCADEMQRTLSQSVAKQCVTKTECSNPNVNLEIRNVVRSACEVSQHVQQDDPASCSKTYGDYVTIARLHGNSTVKIGQEALDKRQVDSTNDDVQHMSVAIPCDRASEHNAAMCAVDYYQHTALILGEQVDDAMFVGQQNSVSPNASNITSVERTSLSNKETHRPSIECDVTDSPPARLYDDRSETCETRRDNDADGFGVISRIAYEENTDPYTLDYRSCTITNDASLTDITASDVDICKMLDANIEAPLTQLIAGVHTTVPSCDIELNDCTVLSSLTQLLEIADDCQTVCLDGNRVTECLNESTTSDVDVVTVDSDILDREQSVAHTLSAASRASNSRALCSLDERISTTASNARQCTDTVNDRLTYGVLKECASSNVRHFSIGASSEASMVNCSIGKSKRIPCCDSEPVNTDRTYQVYSDNSAWKSHCTDDLPLKFHRTKSRQVCMSPLNARKHSLRGSNSTTGGDICDTGLATNFGTKCSTKPVATPTNERCSVLPKVMHNSVSTLLLPPMPISSPHACESQNMTTVTETHWTVTPSGDTSVRLRRTNEMTWSVQKSGDCSLRFSVTKQRMASQSVTDCNVTSVSRKTTKRRKLF